MNIRDYVQSIYSLRDLNRYNNTIHLKDESVAEHLAFVTLIVLEMHKTYDFNLQKAMIMAVTHDLSEIHVTDIPHNVKANYPAIGKEIKKAEQDVFNKYFPQVAPFFQDLEEGKSPEAMVVYAADILSCIQYSSTEVKLGNVGYMKKVLDESEERFEEMAGKLEPLLRSIE